MHGLCVLGLRFVQGPMKKAINTFPNPNKGHGNFGFQLILLIGSASASRKPTNTEKMFLTSLDSDRRITYRGCSHSMQLVEMDRGILHYQ